MSATHMPNTGGTAGKMHRVEIFAFTNYNRKTSVYHTVNGDPALFRTSKTAKMIKVILLRAPCQNVNAA